MFRFQSCYSQSGRHTKPISYHSRRSYDVLSIIKMAAMMAQYYIVFGDATLIKRTQSTTYKPHTVDIYEPTAAKKQTSAILKFHFRIRSQPDHRFRHFMTHWSTRLYPNCIIDGGVMMSYRFSRWWPLWRNFTSGFGLGDVAFFRRSCLSAYHISSE